MATKAKKDAPRAGAQIELLTLRPEDLHVEDGFNPRSTMEQEALQSLADSILEHGLLQPVIARPNGGTPKLIGGHRRLAAAKLAGITEIPVIVRKNGGDDLVEAVVDNAHRVDLTPVEEAIAFGRLQAQGMTVDGIAKSLSVPKTRVTQRLRILELPPNAQDAIANGTISTRDVAVLSDVAVKSLPLAAALAEQIVSGEDLHSYEAIDGAIQSSDSLLDPFRIVIGSKHYKLTTDEHRKAAAAIKSATAGYSTGAYAAQRAARKHFPRLEAHGEQLTVALPDQLVEQGVAAGAIVVLTAKERWGDDDVDYAVCVDQAFVQENLGPLLLKTDADVKAALKRVKEQVQPGSTSNPASGDDAAATAAAEKAERDAEREKKARERAEAIEFNKRLGKSLREGLANYKATPELLQLLLEVGISHPDTDSMYGSPTREDAWRIAWTGLRLTEEWTETTTTKGGKENVAYITNKGELTKRLWAYLTGGKSVDEWAQRIAIAFAAAHYGKSEACRTVKEVDYHRGSPFHGEAAKCIEKIAHKHVPGTRKRVGGSTSADSSRPLVDVLADTEAGETATDDVAPTTGELDAAERKVLLARTAPEWRLGVSDKPLTPLAELAGLTVKETIVVCGSLSRRGLLAPPQAGGYIVTPAGKAVAKSLRAAAADAVGGMPPDKVNAGISEKASDELRELGWTEQPDGSFTAPGTPKLAAKPKPKAKAKEAPKTRAGKDPRAKEALELVKARPGITIPELAEAMGIQQNTLYRIMPALQEDGKVIKSGRGWHVRQES